LFAVAAFLSREQQGDQRGLARYPRPNPTPPPVMLDGLALTACLVGA
jgi:hypothetical protein